MESLHLYQFLITTLRFVKKCKKKTCHITSTTSIAVVNSSDIEKTKLLLSLKCIFND